MQPNWVRFARTSQHNSYWDDTPNVMDTLDAAEPGYSSNPSLLPRENASRHQQATDKFTAGLWPELKDREFHVLKLIGRALEDACRNGDVLSKISAYEARLLRQLDHLIIQLGRWRPGAEKVQATNS